MGRNFKLGLVCFSVFLQLIVLTATEYDVIEKGASWLAGQQNENGSWSAGDQTLVDTAKSYKVLKFLNLQEQATNNAFIYLSTINERHTDSMARKLSVLFEANRSNSELLNKIIDLQNLDGGWGLGEKKKSDVDDTIIVLDALLKNESTSSTVIAKARDYLISQQQVDDNSYPPAKRPFLWHCKWKN